MSLGDWFQDTPADTKNPWRAFAGGPVVKTSPSNAEGEGWIPGQAAKIPQAFQEKNRR